MVPALAYSPRAYAQVPSALKGLTSEFGMGSGVALSQVAPEPWCLFYINTFIPKMWENQMAY